MQSTKAKAPEFAAKLPRNINRQNEAHSNRLSRSKMVFRAYLDAKLIGDENEAANLLKLWLRLLGKAVKP